MRSGKNGVTVVQNLFFMAPLSITTFFRSLEDHRSQARVKIGQELAVVRRYNMSSMVSDFVESDLRYFFMIGNNYFICGCIQ